MCAGIQMKNSLVVPAGLHLFQKSDGGEGGDLGY